MCIERLEKCENVLSMFITLKDYSVEDSYFTPRYKFSEIVNVIKKTE